MCWNVTETTVRPIGLYLFSPIEGLGDYLWECWGQMSPLVHAFFSVDSMPRGSGVYTTDRFRNVVGLATW